MTVGNKKYHELFIERVKMLSLRTEELYIYGAGFYGKDIFRILHKEGVHLDGFLVTESKFESVLFELPVFPAKQKMRNGIGYIIAMTPIYAKEVYDYLTNNGIDDSMIAVYEAYNANGSGRGNYAEKEILEVTATVGCKVNCRYCPQEVLINKYFKADSHRIRYMEPETLKNILLHISEDSVIMFAGFGEPFLNPHCLELVKIACECGNHPVHFFTTLEGATVDDVYSLTTLPIELCTLHLADSKGYAKISKNEEYYKKLEIILNARKTDGSLFVDYINAQTEPDNRAYEMCKDNFEVMVSVHDRAGNISAGGAEHVKVNLKCGDAIECQCVGKMLNSNVVLPDGTLVLCNSDYGMKHVLGNLVVESMETIRKGKAFQEIKSAMLGKSNMDLLCYKCTNARKVNNKMF